MTPNAPGFPNLILNRGANKPPGPPAQAGDLLLEDGTEVWLENDTPVLLEGSP